MKFLEYSWNYFIGGSFDGTLTAGFLIFVILCFPAVVIIENLLQKKKKKEKEFKEL